MQFPESGQYYEFEMFQEVNGAHAPQNNENG